MRSRKQGGLRLKFALLSKYNKSIEFLCKQRIHMRKRKVNSILEIFMSRSSKSLFYSFKIMGRVKEVVVD